MPSGRVRYSGAPWPDQSPFDRTAYEAAVPEREVASGLAWLTDLVVAALVLEQPAVQVVLPARRSSATYDAKSSVACHRSSSVERSSRSIRCHRVRWPTRVAAPRAAYCSGVEVWTVPRIVLPRTIAPDS